MGKFKELVKKFKAVICIGLLVFLIGILGMLFNSIILSGSTANDSNNTGIFKVKLFELKNRLELYNDFNDSYPKKNISTLTKKPYDLNNNLSGRKKCILLVKAYKPVWNNKKTKVTNYKIYFNDDVTTKFDESKITLTKRTDTDRIYIK